MYVHMYVCMYVCICMCVCMCVRTYVCMYVCVCIYIYINNEIAQRSLPAYQLAGSALPGRSAGPLSARAGSISSAVRPARRPANRASSISPLDQPIVPARPASTTSRRARSTNNPRGASQSFEFRRPARPASSQQPAASI